jgi:hypothetical protein
MSTTFEQARALYGSDEQMARALFDQVAVLRLDLQLQQALRRRAEERLEKKPTWTKKRNNEETEK